MGVKDLLPRLPSKPVNMFTIFPEKKKIVDAANVLFSCALEHAENFHEGDLSHSLASFKRIVEFWRGKSGFSFMLVFDGKAYEPKINEHIRRTQKRSDAEHRIAASKAAGDSPRAADLHATVTNTAEYICLATKILDHLHIEYVVAPAEADFQIAYLCSDSSATIALSKDSDMLALRLYLQKNQSGQTHQRAQIKKNLLSAKSVKKRAPSQNARWLAEMR
jgi:exonuclease-1